MREGIHSPNAAATPTALAQAPTSCSGVLQGTARPACGQCPIGVDARARAGNAVCAPRIAEKWKLRDRIEFHLWICWAAIREDELPISLARSARLRSRVMQGGEGSCFDASRTPPGGHYWVSWTKRRQLP